MNQQITCHEILQIINSQMKHASTQYFCIFDLDDTIFDASYRRIFIYEYFLRRQFNLPRLNPYLQRCYYNFIPLIKNEKSFQDFRSEIVKRFFHYFLSESFLWLDRPFSGVRSFLNSLNMLRVPVIFLTGRLESLMKKRTCGLLEAYGLTNSIKAEDYLVMRQDAKTPDPEFKRKEMKQILNAFPEQKFIIFDNESENCRTFREITPNETMIIRFDSVQKSNLSHDGFVLKNWML